ncbi:MAG: hypothetical protein U9P79_05640 [Candidatus Cloacimonadota bacterium]|nr:hypothetical protein [Candidatus Cloacimonadota bacterium]
MDTYAVDRPIILLENIDKQKRFLTTSCNMNSEKRNFSNQLEHSICYVMEAKKQWDDNIKIRLFHFNLSTSLNRH